MKGSMSHRKCVLAGILGLGIAFFFSSDAQAGYRPKKPCRCNDNGSVFESEFFGYYPTCWRKFPPQPECCPAPEVTPVKPKPVAEALPEPKPAKAPAPLQDETKPLPKEEVKPTPKPAPKVE